MSRVAGLLFAAIALIGCAMPAAATPDPGSVDVDCQTFESTPEGTPVEQTLTVAVDVVFRVSLCSNPSTGFSWSDPTMDGDPVMTQTSTTTETRAGAPPGAAGRQVFSFLTSASGATTLRFSYGQPWDGGTKDVWQLELDVTVG